jgi:hypothetical protein
MSILVKHLPFVKDQIGFQQRMLERFAGDSYREKMHASSKEKFEALLADLEIADQTLDRKQEIRTPKAAPQTLALTPEEIEGLPPELLKELSVSDADKTEFILLNLLEEAGGIASLDRLLIGLWKKSGEVHKRQSLVSRLYRMAQKDLVFGVPGKKGVYSNRPVDEGDFQRLFNESLRQAEDYGKISFP